MSIAYSFSKTDRSKSINAFSCLTTIDGGSGDRNSPSPDAYNPENAIRAVKEVSPEWR